MSKIGRFLASAALLFVASPAAADDRAGIEFFESRIRPVLVDHCYSCHSTEAEQVQAGLLLDSRTGWKTGGDSGPAITAGDPDGSLLIQVLRYQSYEMPPTGKLPAEIIDDFVRWIEMGAPDPRDGEVPLPRESIDWEAARQFWAFRPIADPRPPNVKSSTWPITSIDHFILAGLQQKGLEPAEPADKRTLIRRATFDLTGLPPTPDEVEAFLADDSPDAFARVVDRLLDSPHYGERWARWWLDIARYAEDQAHSFRPRLYPYGYRYRDWLVGAFNQDMPYERFVKEQIAADLLDEPDRREHLPALGFFATGPVYYGDRQMYDQYDDRIDTLTRGFMALTVACARCHDHKYDPIPTADYYSLAGIIASSEYVQAPLAPDDVVTAYDEAQERIEAAEKEIEELLEAQAERLEVEKKDVEKELPDELQEKLAAMRDHLEQLKAAAPTKYPVAHAIRDRSEPRNLNILIRGEPGNQGDEVPRRSLQILAGHDAPPLSDGSGRRELAEWIASPDNPLTARVMVNRVWQRHFGRGLVATPSNFGLLGQQPTHPELLDHLTTRFITGGWSIKKLHREIMLSATYQLSSTELAAGQLVDPENRLLWRQNRRRLEVEPWRDSMLAVAGNLDSTFGGPSVDLAAQDNRRRTLYAKISRHDLDSLLRLFDFPDPNITAGERPVTTVPLQQLFLFNSPFVLDQSRTFARRMQESAERDTERIEQGYLLAFGRPPTDVEMQRDVQFLEHAEETDVLTPWEQFAQVLLSTNEFMYID